MRLVVKGAQLHAIEAAKLRGVENVCYIHASKDCSVIAVADDDATLRKVVKWYCEPVTTPFEPGALLFYQAPAARAPRTFSYALR